MRTKKTLLNMVSESIPLIVMGLLGFIKIRIFLDYLGDEFYGISQLFNQIFNYLNLAEAGFGTAIVYALYKPIVENNREAINRILSGARLIFKRIGIAILIIGGILSFFMDYLIKDNSAVTYTQILFIIYLITSTLNYFVFAPRFMLQADQNKYVINWVVNSIRIIQILTEIVLLMNGFDLTVIYISYLIFMIANNAIINKLAYKRYPWIDIHKEEPDLSTYSNTRHVLMHKIGNIIALNTDNIVLSVFIGSKMVAIYSSYNYVIQFIISITTRVINASQESFGNFFVLKDKKEGLNTYWEMNALLFFIGSVLFTVTYTSILDFIRLYLHRESYIVDNSTVLLFCIVFFIQIIRGTYIVIVNGIGAFKETKWQALFEGIINVVLSVILVVPFNINGVLLATVISYLLTGFWFVPGYVFKNIFNKSVFFYYGNFFINIIILSVVLLITHEMLPLVGLYQNNHNLFDWVVDSTIFTSSVSIVYFIIYFILFKHFRQFVQRIILMFHNRLRNI